MVNREVVDITPHPQILTVLGEIEFKPSQCIAELVDNSIDGFLRMARSGTPIFNPTAHIAFGRDTVTIQDNGPGMSIDDLENAVKAGWTSNERFGSLGLYGVGFNIATARLGALTTIWTTQVGSDQWYGLEIDLQKLASGKHYKLDVKTMPKSDINQSGTRIDVSKIKSDWKDSFASAAWIKYNITDRLARIYGAMLRDINPQPIKFSLYVNNKKVFAWEHCVWPEDWTVYRKEEGLVSPIQIIDENFGIKYVSRSTGEIYETSDGLKPDDILEIPERVYGWIGIQRYTDEKDFGIDILRNGRKIEIGCKDLFEWEKPDGETILEYPIDDPRHRGRIVGEIHLDHGYVHYTKHRFEREHSSWNQLKKVIRYDEPLTHRNEFNYPGVNISPLGILYRAFRRNSPPVSSKLTFEDLLIIKDNETAKIWAKEYRKANSEYLDNNKWREELKKSDGKNNPPANNPPANNPPANNPPANNPPANNPPTQPSDEDFLFRSMDMDATESGYAAISADPSLEEASTSDNPSLIQPATDSSKPDFGKIPETPKDYSFPESTKDTQTPVREIQRLIWKLNVTGITDKTYDVEVFEVENAPNSFNKSAWTAQLTARGVYDIQVNTKHSAFNSTSLQVRDAVLAQVAHLITSEESASAGSRSDVSYSDILVSLRNRYALQESLDTNYMRVEISEISKRFAKSLAKILIEDRQKDLLNILSPEDRTRIRLAHARGPKNTSILVYFEMKHWTRLLKEQPEIFFEEAHCFKQSWTPSDLDLILLTEHRERIVQDVLILATVLGEFMDDLTPIQEQTRSYLALIRSSINRLKELLLDEQTNV